MTTLTIRLEYNDSPLEYTDTYIDIIWTPLVGSTATATLRVLAHLARLHHGHTTIPTAELASAVGCKPSRIHHALQRLQRTQLLTANGDTITVYSALPTAPAKRIQTLAPWAIDYAHNRHRHPRTP